jgi:hypothetical protein
MSEEQQVQNGSEEKIPQGNSTDASTAISWEDFVKTYGSGKETPASEDKKVSLQEKLSFENSKSLYDKDIQFENPLEPLAFFYEFSIYEKDDNHSAEMVGSLRDAKREMGTILNSYPKDWSRVLADNMTLPGGWQELIRKGAEKMQDRNFGKAIQKYINLRISDLELQHNDLRLTPIDAANQRSLRESFIKTLTFVNQGISR